MLDDALLRKIISSADVGACEITQMTGGRNNYVFKLVRNGAEPLVVKIAKAASKDDLLLEGRLLLMLSSSGFNVPVPKISNIGEPIMIYNQDNVEWAILVMSFLEGEPIFDPEHFRKLGTVLSAMHSLAPPEYVPVRKILDPSNIARRNIPNIMSRKIGPLLEEALSLAGSYSEVSKVLCHGDVPGNVFFGANAEIIVLDFERSSLDNRFSDVASAAYSAFSASGDSHGSFEKLVGAYAVGLDEADVVDRNDILLLTSLIGIRIAKWRFENCSNPLAGLDTDSWQEPLDVTRRVLDLI